MCVTYKTTDKMSEYISHLRCRKLGYGVLNFGRLFGHDTSSWCSNLEKNHTVKQNIELLDLMKLFIIDYDYDLFVTKIKLMENVVEDTKKSLRKNSSLSLSKILRISKRITDARNGGQYSPPFEIFGIEDIYQFSDFNKYADNFRDEDFPLEDRYIPIINSEQDFFRIPKEQLKQLESFIVKRCYELLDSCNQEELHTEYWIYAMILMCEDVVISENCQTSLFNYFKRATNIQNNSYEEIFRELGENKIARDSDSSPSYNAVYFKDKKNEKMSFGNLPIFYVHYKANQDTFEEKIAKAKKDNSFKVADLFMIFFTFMRYGGMEEEKAFENAWVELHFHRVDLPFNRLNLINLPERGPLSVPADFLSFFKILYDFFVKNHDKKSNNYPELEKLWDNVRTYQHRYINTVALDFKDIEKISEGRTYQLQKELQATLDAFVKRYI